MGAGCCLCITVSRPLSFRLFFLLRFYFYFIWLKRRNERNKQIENVIKRKFARLHLRFCVTCRSRCVWAPLLLKFKPYFFCSTKKNKEQKRNTIPNSKWTNSCFIIKFINHFVFVFLNWKCEEKGGGYKIGNGQCAPRKSAFPLVFFSIFFFFLRKGRENMRCWRKIWQKYGEFLVVAVAGAQGDLWICFTFYEIYDKKFFLWGFREVNMLAGE